MSMIHLPETGTSRDDSGVSTRPLPPDEVRALWDFADPEASERRFAAAAADAARPVGHRAELITQQARALGLQQRFDEADALLDDLDAGRLVPLPLPDVAVLRVELERGRLRRAEGSLRAAVVHLQAAAEEATFHGYLALAVDALHMLALADPDHAEQWTAQALDVVHESTDPEVRRWLVALHTNLGWTRHDAGEHEAALEAFRAAQQAAADREDVEQEQIARWSVARCLRSLGRFAEAREMQEQLAVERPGDEYVAEELAALATERRD